MYVVLDYIFFGIIGMLLFVLLSIIGLWLRQESFSSIRLAVEVSCGVCTVYLVLTTRVWPQYNHRVLAICLAIITIMMAWVIIVSLTFDFILAWLGRGD